MLDSKRVPPGGGAITITLPSDLDDPPFDGQQFVIKDASGDAGMNDITVESLTHSIDGAPPVIDQDWGSVTVQFSAAENMWLVISAT